MEMIAIPMAQPKVEPQTSQHSKADKPSDLSFTGVLEQTCLTGHNEASYTATDSSEKIQPKSDEASLTEQQPDPLELAAAGLAVQHPEPLRLPPTSEATINPEGTDLSVSSPSAGKQAIAPLAPSQAESLSFEAQGKEAENPVATGDSQTHLQQTVENSPARREESGVTSRHQKPLQESQPAPSFRSEIRDPAGLTESTLGGMIRSNRLPTTEGRPRWNGESLREGSVAINAAKPASNPAAAGLEQQNAFDAVLSEQPNNSLTSSNRNGSRESGVGSGQTSFDALLENNQHNPINSPAADKPPSASVFAPNAIFTADGGPVTENQVVEQVLERLSLERSGDRSRIVIKLNPEELGEVKLSLTLEKDQLRAQLLTQNPQVQEILEKHLPKLHEALEKQGLKLEDIQVEVDSGRNPGKESFADRHQSPGFRRIFGETPVDLNNGLPLAATASRQALPTEGLSLRI